MSLATALATVLATVLARFLALASAMTLVSACATGVKVTTTTTPGTDWSKYATYALVPPTEARTVVREELEQEVGDELDARGYRSVAVGQSDLLVVIQTEARPAERQVFADSPGGCCVIQAYVAGRLSIAVFDAGSSEMIWHGVGEVDLHRVSDGTLEKAASDAAGAVLAELPRRGDR